MLVDLPNKLPCYSKRIKMNEIINAEAGYRRVIDFVSRKGFMVDIVPVNNNRYFILKTTNGNIMVMFKRDLFRSFGKIFEDKGEVGEGETINMDDLRLATAVYRVKKLIFVYQDRSIKSISVEDFLIYSHKIRG